MAIEFHQHVSANRLWGRYGLHTRLEGFHPVLVVIVEIGPSELERPVADDPPNRLAVHESFSNIEADMPASGEA